MALIHPTAIIEDGAELDESVSVDAFSIIRSNVRIGAGTTVGPHCVIEGRTTIGSDNRIFQFCSIGAIPRTRSTPVSPPSCTSGTETPFARAAPSTSARRKTVA
jgi:UDP-N-acetylglucosamine acyltransferase